MENLIVTRENCNTFNFEYSDTSVDLTINIKEIPTVGVWDGDISALPTYLTITIPHIIPPAILPNVYNLTLPSDKIYGFEYIKIGYTETLDLYVPSIDELVLISTVLFTPGAPIWDEYPSGAFIDPTWSSSEDGVNNVWVLQMGDSTPISHIKRHDTIYMAERLSPLFVRSFIRYESTPSLHLNDKTLSGYIYRIEILGNQVTYYELYTSIHFASYNWLVTFINLIQQPSEFLNTIIGLDSGKNNTDIIKSYVVAHELLHGDNSAIDLTHALEANPPIIEHLEITEYSIYSIFCDLLACRLALLKRVLGELDNCKERCDCIAVYDYIAFSTIYEAITSLYYNIFHDYNVNMQTGVLTVEQLEVLTTFEDLLIQYKKYCIECEKPCKNC